jgi:hypothetical protein
LFKTVVKIVNLPRQIKIFGSRKHRCSNCYYFVSHCFSTSAVVSVAVVIALVGKGKKAHSAERSSATHSAFVAGPGKLVEIDSETEAAVGIELENSRTEFGFVAVAAKAGSGLAIDYSAVAAGYSVGVVGLG